MPLAKQESNEGVDLSNYFEKPSDPSVVHANTNQQAAAAHPSSRLWLLIAAAILLGLAQVAILLFVNKKPVNQIPAGYHIVKPANGPIRVEKIK